MDILENLNPAQREAVQTIEGPVLVLAGPGSGKTRVLTHRVAYLIRECGIPPYNIMAVTFTNKAAREMKERLHHLIGRRLGQLTIGTFHATCARILRREAQHLGLERSFVIYDDGDQLSLIKQAVKELDLDDKMYRPTAIQGAIRRAKQELISPDAYTPQTYWHEVARRVYTRYQELLRANNALDFDDLLMATAQLFREHPEVLEKYQRRYLHILVDEFQDTNMAQYELVKLLAGGRRNPFVVADEDQSIYGWRGADFRNIQRFRRDFPEAKIILLEQNYRSTQAILDAARSVIALNTQRTDKRLWTDKKGGVPLTLFEAYNEQEEAEYVVSEIQRLVARDGYRPGDCAVMYRTNAQSRALEDAFVRRGVPYKLVGATRFYERREIRDILAYLRLIHNPFDQISLERIINVPPRGIGRVTLAQLARWAEKLNVPVYTALQLLKEETGQRKKGAGEPVVPFNTRTQGVLLNFLALLDDLIAARQEKSVPELLDLVLERTGYAEYIRDGTEEGEDRWANLLELRGVAQEYAGLGPEMGLTTFLEEVALVSDVDNLDERVDAPTLLTLHSAKGLEFPVVFIVGLEEGLLPHSRSMDDPNQMEEERRLCYVGLTRAKERLYLVYTFRHTLHGTSAISEPSRFLGDIPPHLIRGWNGTAVGGTEVRELVGTGGTEGTGLVGSFKAGDKVRHPKFGEGIVVSARVTGDDEEVEVAFVGHGVKKLLVSFARLEKMD
ncbi:MAG: ATP-dependent helicase [Anaerolineae bacterium]